MHYGMFSDKGNEHVDKIVQSVLALDNTDPGYRYSVAVGCLDELCNLAADGCEAEPGQETPFDEAYDTVVRDAVWEAINLASAPPA